MEQEGLPANPELAPTCSSPARRRPRGCSGGRPPTSSWTSRARSGPKEIQNLLAPPLVADVYIPWSQESPFHVSVAYISQQRDSVISPALGNLKYNSTIL